MQMTVDNPASWQEDEAAFGLGQLDDLECEAVFGGGVGGSLAGIALIDPSKFDGVVGDGLYGTREPLSTC